MLKFIKKHWEQAFFGSVGLAFLTFSFVGLMNGDITGASATFAMAFFSFIYANISRFKRFKGLGFEAELWEDKQKEAAQLIDRLKAVVSVYTREIVLGRVKNGRFSDGVNWEGHWKLYHELVEKHSDLGQEIDFSDLKKSMDEYFVFDMVSILSEKIRKPIKDGRGEARKVIETEFGSPIKDSAGYSLRLKQLEDAPEKFVNMFKIAQEDDLAERILEWGTLSQIALEKNFSVTIDFDDDAVENLKEISRLYRAGPIEVTPELIAYTANR
jgi:hypothetical protein